jgi:hypothetical protein
MCQGVFFLKLRVFSRSDLSCIGICRNTLSAQKLWFFKAHYYSSGVPGSRKKGKFIGLAQAKHFGLFERF